MKYITFVVPSYNAAKYLDRCIPSLVPGGDDVEIIIVNDGSKDNTLEVARSYEAKYSNVKVIDKENGGHGSGINAGLKIAQGIYFKCIDADDWVDTEGYKKLLDTIKEHVGKGTNVDMYLTEFVYNRLDEGITHSQSYEKTYPANKLCTWKDFSRPNNMDFLMMHMLTFKTEILRKSGLDLPLHTFYVDNLYVYQPLYYVETIYYLPVKFYQYYVGRTDQSISRANMAKNYKHDFRVFDRIIHCYSFEELNKLDKKHRDYMFFSIVVFAVLALNYSVVGKKLGAKKDFKELMRVWKRDNKKLYNFINFRTRYWVTHLFFIPFVKDLAIDVGYRIVLKKTGWY